MTGAASTARRPRAASRRAARRRTDPARPWRAPGPSRFAAHLRAERGQSSVELVALLPLALLVGLAVLTLLASRAASGQASAAAQAGAMALLQGGDPHEAARAAVPRESRPRATIAVRGRRVTVTVEPATRVGFLADALAATATADAGPVSR
jgi:hypothetical protein